MRGAHGNSELMRIPRLSSPGRILSCALVVLDRVVDDHAATMSCQTAGNPYFRANRKIFRATDFIAELLAPP